MALASRYTLLGLSVFMVAGIFLFFSDEDNIEYEFSGIVHDVGQSTNGYTFYIQTEDAESDVRCFSRDMPSDLGYYAVSGEFSDDGNIFFVSVLRNLDVDPL